VNTEMSTASRNCPSADMKPARWWPRELPGDGHGICPVLAITGRGAQLNGLTPWPARAWLSRTLSPLVWQTCAWWRSRSTVAVARVLGISSSNATGVPTGSIEDVLACGGCDLAFQAGRGGR